MLSSIAKRINNNLLTPNDEFIKDHLQGIEIKWQDEEESNYRDIDFFPQSHMYEIAKDTQKTDELIEKIIKEKDESKLLIAYNNFCDNNRTEIINKTNTLFQLQSEIDKRKIELKEKGDKQGIEKEIKLFEERISKVNNGDEITPEVLSEYELINKTIAEKGQLRITLEKDIEVLENIKYKNIFNQSIEYEFNSFSEKTRISITDIFSKVKQEATKIWFELLEQQISELKERNQLLIKDIIEEEAKEAYKKGIKYYQDNKQYQELQTKLNEERKKLSEILEIEKSLKNQEEQKQKLQNEIINSHYDYHIKVNELVNSLKLECGGISITPSVIFNKESIKKFIEERFNLRGTDRQKYVDDFIDNYQSKLVEYTNNFLQQTLEKKIDFKGIYSDKSQPTVTSELLSTNWFNITYKLKYQNDIFSEMSPGKQAFVILKLLLEFSDKKCPILIDQPEDSLDNRAIYTELVKYLKDKKKERQIVIVTHNSNIVVGADSEQVIIANQHGKDSKNRDSIKFQYVAGSLENTCKKVKTNKIVLESQGIREHVCEILEGGNKAFKKREQKYNLPNDFDDEE